MPHEIIFAGERRALRDIVEIDHPGQARLGRVLRLANGDAVVITAVEATRDGVPMLGNISVVSWGVGALIRVARMLVEVVWRAQSAPRAAEAGRRCRVCFGSFTAGELAVACPCAALFHSDCHTAYLSCPDCGAPREAVGG